MEYSDFYSTINTIDAYSYRLSSAIYILEIATFLDRTRQNSKNCKGISPELLTKLRLLLSEFELKTSRSGMDFKTVALLETLKLSEYLINQIQPQIPCILEPSKIPPPPPPPMPVVMPSIVFSTPTKRRLPKSLLENQKDSSLVDEIKMGRRLRVISLKRNPSGTPVKTKKYLTEEDFFFDQIKKKFLGHLEKPEIELEDWQ